MLLGAIESKATDARTFVEGWCVLLYVAHPIQQTFTASSCALTDAFVLAPSCILIARHAIHLSLLVSFRMLILFQAAE